ncbi:MAG: helix-turn-helix domain-containing protein [Nitrosomonadaceae bacterium]
MTPKQQKVLAFYCKTWDEKRCSPSYREIMRHLGYKSTCTIKQHLDQLIERGYLMREGNMGGNRNVILTLKGRAANKREVCPHCNGEL